MATNLPDRGFEDPSFKAFQFADRLVTCNPKRLDVLRLADDALNAGVTDQESLRQRFPKVDSMDLKTTLPKPLSFRTALNRLIAYASLATHHG
jgi:hypothetical protein